MTIFVYVVIYACALVLSPPAWSVPFSMRASPSTFAGNCIRCLTKIPGEWSTAVRISKKSTGWKSPTRFHLLGELKFMIPEMLFLKGLYEFNRKLWVRSFPFHFGLYILIGTLALVVFRAMLSIFAPAAADGMTGSIIHLAYTFTGVAGLALAVLGALGLLKRRLSDDGDKDLHTTPGDIFNLVFFVVALGTLFAAYMFRPASAPGVLLLRTPRSSDVRHRLACSRAFCRRPDPRSAAHRVHSPDPHVAFHRQVLPLPLHPLGRRAQ